MAKARYTGTVQDLTGIAMTSARVQVIREGSAVDEPLWSDRAGTIPLDNPVLSNPDGSFFFHATGGAFRFVITAPGLTREVRYVPVGLAGESDIQGLTPRGVYSAVTTYEIGDMVTKIEAGVYHMFASIQDDNLNNTPDAVTPGDTAFWMYLGVVASMVSTGMSFACSDEVTTLATQTNAIRARNVGILDIAEIRASLNEPSVTGPVIVDINVDGVSILSTKLTIDQGEVTSLTAAVPAVITNPIVPDDSLVGVDIDDAGAGATGLKVTIVAATS